MIKKQKFMLIDSHSHLNFRDFNNDFKKVIDRALKNGVYLINASSNFSTSQKAVEIAESFSFGVYTAVGLHPINIKQEGLLDQSKRPEDVLEDDFDYEKYKTLALKTAKGKIVAIGEIGLDYWKKPKTAGKLNLFKEKQKNIFLKQLNLAKELNLPVIFHCRSAHEELLNILKFQVSSYKLQGVIHCFTGTKEQAQEYLKMGFYLGFNGIIFKLNLDEIIKMTPLDRILVETDCPFLAPPQIEPKRNEPIFVEYVIEKIAQIKKESPEKIAQITTENAGKLFNLKKMIK